MAERKLFVSWDFFLGGRQVFEITSHMTCVHILEDKSMYIKLIPILIQFWFIRK